MAQGKIIGLWTLGGMVVCACLAAFYTAASGDGWASGAVEGAACGVVLGALGGSLAARRGKGDDLG